MSISYGQANDSMCLMSGLPISAPSISLALHEASAWLFPSPDQAQTPHDIVLASYITDFDFRLVSYIQIWLLVVQYRESLPFSPTDPADLRDVDGRWEALLGEYSGYLDVWGARWHAGLGE